MKRKGINLRLRITESIVPNTATGYLLNVNEHFLKVLICLSACLSVCACSIFRNYHRNSMKFIYIFQIWYSMCSVKNSACGANGSYIGTHTNSDTLQPIEWNILMCILTCLHCTNDNVIYIIRSIFCIRNDMSITLAFHAHGYTKDFWYVDYGGNEYRYIFSCVLLFYSI